MRLIGEQLWIYLTPPGGAAGPSLAWLLAGGLWNDAASWDDAAFWEDS